MECMGYRKVYLTIDEEKDLATIKEWREANGRKYGNPAYNAILKEGLLRVASDMRAQKRAEKEKAEAAEESVPVSATTPVRRRTRRRTG